MRNGVGAVFALDNGIAFLETFVDVADRGCVPGNQVAATSQSRFASRDEFTIWAHEGLESIIFFHEEGELFELEFHCLKGIGQVFFGVGRDGQNLVTGVIELGARLGDHVHGLESGHFFCC